MNDLFDLSDELVLMTGGTGTIGLAFGEALLGAGARVVIWSRGKTVPLDGIVATLEEKTGIKGRTFAFPVDVADKESVREGLKRVIEEAGVPTVLINGAGGTRGKAPFIDVDIDAFEDALALNLLGGLMIPTQAVARYWIENQKEGSIINMASMASFVPLSGVWAYNAAKAAVHNLTMGAAKEFAPYGIRVNAIAPGFFIGHQNRDLLYSDFEKRELSPRGRAIISHTPYNRFGVPEDLFGTVVFLASPRASGFITGVTLPVDGGYLIDNI